LRALASICSFWNMVAVTSCRGGRGGARE
jgi:hypothetical protein